MKVEIFAGIFDLPETLDRGPPHYGSGLWYPKQALSSGIRKEGVITNQRLLTETEKALVELYTRNFPELERYRLETRAPRLSERLVWQASQFKKLGVLLPRNRT